MSDRAKEKRFVISGKERLDVGLHEDEFLLQAVFYCMGAGPNPDCRVPMLRLDAVKTLSHRRATPTVRSESRLPAVRVGAPPPAKPYPTAWPRQQAGPNPACRPPMLALPRRQSLIPPPGHANRSAQNSPADRPCWRRPASKTLSHRLATPTGRPESCPSAAHVAAAPCEWAAALIYST